MRRREEAAARPRRLSLLTALYAALRVADPTFMSARKWQANKHSRSLHF